MFNLFGKKRNQPADAQPVAAGPEVAALAAQFDPEEFDILAVTGVSGFATQDEDEGGAPLRTAVLPLVAWREEDGPICREAACIVCLADDTLLDYLRRRAPRDGIIQARVRKAMKGNRFLLVGLPSPTMDRELKQILDEETRPISIWAEGLGTFTLNRQVNWFQAESEWLGQPIQLTYDRAQEPEMQQARDTALALLSQQADWDQRLRAFTAGQLLDQLLESEQEERADPSTGEELAARMEPESLQAGPGDAFCFWFRDGDFSCDCLIRVSGTLANGPVAAELE